MGQMLDRDHMPVGSSRNGRSLERRPQVDGEGPGLGDIAKDAIDHVSAIVSDSVALGKLEAKRIAGKVEETAKEVVPRAAFGLMAMMLGLIGSVLGLVAIFVGLGALIPSVAVRLAIFAAVFLLLAGVGAFFAARPMKKDKKEEEIKVTAPVVRVPVASAPLPEAKRAE